jgi:hypothetical protein
MISDYRAVRGLFQELDAVIAENVNVFMIGGGALMKRGLKLQTKDIDLVVENNEIYRIFLEAFTELGFVSEIPGKPYERLSVSQILTRGDLRADLFCKEVCGKFSLSEGMKSRALEEDMGLERISLNICSPEDIFLFKTMTERDGDEEDCANIIRDVADLDWQVILDEAIKQSKAGEAVWITWITYRLEQFAEKNIRIPILSDMVNLADKYAEEWMRAYDKSGNFSDKKYPQ